MNNSFKGDSYCNYSQTCYRQHRIKQSPSILVAGAHYPERATAIGSCNGVFTSKFIFRVASPAKYVVFAVLVISSSYYSPCKYLDYCQKCCPNTPMKTRVCRLCSLSLQAVIMPHINHALACDWLSPTNSRERLSKNNLTCENAVSQTQYGSCTLRVMGSC